ncbi:MAG: PSD1 domain-containing protein [Verrucomicrobiales bacterium]|nr:PSD1 domain-containing protein [Verrucomicrobiales bacterium]
MAVRVLPFPVRRFLAVAPLLCLLPASLLKAANVPDFNRDIAPILSKHCLECHSGAEPSGKLSLITHEGFLKGGESGPVTNSSHPEKGELFSRVSEGIMPPQKQGKSRKLPAAEIVLLQSWITSGAPWPSGRVLDPFEVSTDLRGGRDLWSLQPVRRPALPLSAKTDNPIDAFVRQKLSAKGWSPAPPADPRTLVRRLYIDLTGLPPTSEQITAFVADPSPAAYEAMVDRLLASPRFGERWGRYWLDIARYAETCGYERDQVKPNVWRYRDWVIRAFNEDLPYNQFIMAQLAGDEMPGHNEESLVATGFLRLGTWNDEPNDAEEYKYERLEDMVHVTSTAFLGLTVKCARCHDHKFDPISQLDYYRMAGAFWAGYIQPGQGSLGGPDAKALGSEVFGWTDASPTPPPLPLLVKGDPKRPSKPVAPATLSFLPQLSREITPAPAGSKTSQRRRQLAEWIADPKNPLTARVWVNRLWQFHFGQALVRSPDNFGFTGEKPTHAELLDWLADELVAGGWRAKRLHKLLVLSETYRQSSIHPAQERYAQEDFANHLWWRAERRRLDADALRDGLLSVSGTLDLRKMGGPSFAPVISPDALEGLSMKGQAWKASPAEEQGRRSIYMFSKRSLLSPMATVFDFPDTTLPCGQRDVTVVAPQALALLNNATVHEQSRALARRVMSASASQDARSRITKAWQLALGRVPAAAETAAAIAHLQRQRDHFLSQTPAPKQAPAADPDLLALSSLCHVLLNSNEFIYVD